MQIFIDTNMLSSTTQCEIAYKSTTEGILVSRNKRSQANMLHNITRSTKIWPYFSWIYILTCVIHNHKRLVFSVVPQVTFDAWKGLLNGIQIEGVQKKKDQFAF